MVDTIRLSHLAAGRSGRTLTRSLKYECVYLHAWESGSQARAGIGRWITFYNHQRPHAAHGGQPPAVVYFTATQTDQQVQAVA